MTLRFRTLGRAPHPILETPADLLAATELEDARWVATALPIASLRGDPVFYARLDTDGDGRVRSDELREAIRWTFLHLANTRGLGEGSSSLRLADLEEGGPDSAALRDVARSLGAAEDAVSLEAVRAALEAERAGGLSAAGMLRPQAAGEDAALRVILEGGIRFTGGVEHPSGARALSREGWARLLDAARARQAWRDAAPEASGALGEGCAAAAEAVDAVADKVDQLFLLCDALALEPTLGEHLRADAEGIDLLEPTQATTLLRRAPLLPPRAGGGLERDGALNPVWREAVERLFADAVEPALGSRSLDRAGWSALGALLAPYRAWLAAAPPDPELQAEALAERAESLEALFAMTEERARVAAGLERLERLLLNQAHLLRFANNMIAMPELMSADTSGLMERGRLILDGREFDLSVRVLDPARAERFGAMSPIYTMFVQVGAKGGQWTEELAVPVTAGERGHLVDGQWGVFLPVDGGELHARIRKIASSPISIREALLAPFRRVGAALQAAADKAAAAQHEAMGAQVSGAAAQASDAATGSAAKALATGEAAKAAPAAPSAVADVAAAPTAAGPAAPAATPASSPSAFAGQLPLLLAGAGIAFAALASAGAYVANLFWGAASALSAGFLALGPVSELGPGALAVTQVVALPVAVLVVLLGVLLVPALLYAIPVAIATWLRLRQRDLSTLLEGAGWAMNARLMLDRDHAVRLTRRPGE